MMIIYKQTSHTHTHNNNNTTAALEDYKRSNDDAPVEKKKIRWFFLCFSQQKKNVYIHHILSSITNETLKEKNHVVE